jgi:hypothetical protein
VITDRIHGRRIYKYIHCLPSSTKGGLVSLVDPEETLKPEMKAVYLNVGSLASEVGVGVMKVPPCRRKAKRDQN